MVGFLTFAFLVDDSNFLLIKAVQNLQLENGCFSATKNGSEADTRFMFCACAICSILNEWSPINIDKAVDYIISCMTYEGGISLAPGVQFNLALATRMA